MKKQMKLDYSSGKILKKIEKLKEENKKISLIKDTEFLEENELEEDNDEDIIIEIHYCTEEDDNRGNVRDFTAAKEYKEKLENCKKKIESQTFGYDEFEERVILIRDNKRYEAFVKEREEKIKVEAQKLRDKEDREMREYRRQCLLEEEKRKREDRTNGAKSACGSGGKILIKIALIFYIIITIPFFGNFLIAIGVNGFVSLVITLFLDMFVIAFIIIR